jgi:hypothetical protein
MTVFEGLAFGGIVSVMLFGLPAAVVGAVLGPFWARFFVPEERYAADGRTNGSTVSRIPEDQDFWARPDSEQIK